MYFMSEKSLLMEKIKTKSRLLRLMSVTKSVFSEQRHSLAAPVLYPEGMLICL